MKKNILITGGSGFIGKSLITELKKRNYSLKIIDSDIRIWDNVKDLEGDVIFHLAAKTSVPYSFSHPREVYETNILGTLNMLELSRKIQAKIIFASTYIYGKPLYLPVDEQHPVSPQNPYALSKSIAENLCQSYSKDYGIKCIILRPFNIYGRGQKESFLIPSIVSQLSNRELILADPEPRRDFLYIDDMVDVCLKAIHYRTNFDIFNIGYGKSYSAKEIANKIIKLAGIRIKTKYLGKRRENEIMDMFADIRKAQLKLGWRPKTDIDSGLKKILENY